MIPLLTGFNTLVLTYRKLDYECGGILIAKVVQAIGTSTTRHVRPQTIQQRHIWDFMSKEIVKANHEPRTKVASARTVLRIASIPMVSRIGVP